MIINCLAANGGVASPFASYTLLQAIRRSHRRSSPGSAPINAWLGVLLFAIDKKTIGLPFLRCS
jgi:hypothetical protein